MFYYSQLRGIQWYFTVVLICISLKTNDVQHLPCAYWPFVYCFRRNIYSNPCLLFNWVILLLLSCKGYLYIPGKFLIRYDLQKCSLILWVVLTLSHSVLWSTKDCNFVDVEFFLWLLVLFGVLSKDPLPNTGS